MNRVECVFTLVIYSQIVNCSPFIYVYICYLKLFEQAS